MNIRPSLFAATASLLMLTAVAGVRAEVVSSLSSPTGQVGTPLQLQYQFINTGEPKDMPRSLMVDGLDIRLTGTSRRVEVVNFQTSSAIIYAYTVIPNRPGNFTIPGFAVQVNGQQVRTDAVDLRVTGPGGSAPPPGPGVPQMMPPPSAPRAPAPGRKPPRSAQGEAAPYYGEIVMGAKTAYVGEVVPVELRFYFRADGQFDNLQRPTFAGDGFTAAPLSEPEQSEQFIDDIPYNVVTFRSAITPVKTGQIEVPSAFMEGQMISAGAPPGMDPFFDQFFQNFPMPGFGRAENIQAKTNARQLEVLPLPKEGRPENFGGAIGQFTLRASANPQIVKAGEPVMLKLALEGRGNFDAIAPPVLTDTDGWRTYAPKEVFNAADAIGYGGTKTFEVSMVARTDQTASPGAELSYFDPIKKQYFTLKTDPVTVTAAGGGEAVADRTAGTQGEDTRSPAEQASAQAQPANDIAPLVVTLSSRAPGFTPTVHQGWFRFLNIALLVVMLAAIPVLVWLRRRARKSAQTAELEAALRQAKAEWQKAAERSTFYAAAADFIVAKLALADLKPAALIDPREALDRRVDDAVERHELQSVLARRDELKYGGGSRGALDPEERRRVTALLEKFSSIHA